MMTFQWLSRAVLGAFVTFSIGEAAMAAKGSGFSESTNTMMNNMVLQRIVKDPEVYKQVVKDMIERQLQLEAREVDPAVVNKIMERVLYARANIPQPHFQPDAEVKIPKIVMFMSGAERRALRDISGLLDAGDKLAILKYYFLLDQGTRDWNFTNFSRGSTEFSNLTVEIPVNSAINLGFGQRRYVAHFQIDHPSDTWQFDETSKSSADLVIKDRNQISFTSFENRQGVVFRGGGAAGGAGGKCASLFTTSVIPGVW